MGIEKGKLNSPFTLGVGVVVGYCVERVGVEGRLEYGRRANVGLHGHVLFDNQPPNSEQEEHKDHWYYDLKARTAT